MVSRVLWFTVFMFTGVCLSLAAIAQDSPDTTKNRIEELRKEVQALKREVQELKTQWKTPEAVQREEIDRLEEILDKRLRELESKIDAMSRAYSPIALNPRTTVFLNVAGRADDEVVLSESGESEIQNRPFLRTVELDFRAPVDPYAEAVVIVALEDEAGKGFGLDAEEAYGLIKRLPVLESAPLGMKIKVGKFRASFGVNNRLHMHDLPWSSRPLVVSKYLGTEQGEFFESGFNPVGIDVDFFLPNPIATSTLELNLGLLRAGDLGLSSENSRNQPAFLAHLNWSRDWNNEHVLTLGLSAYRERRRHSARLYGADFTYKWSPVERRDRRSLVLGGEIFLGENWIAKGQPYCEGDFLDKDVRMKNKPFGWFAYAQYQLSWWSYLGGRYEEVEEPTDDNLKTKAISAYLSYYTTEYLRFRLGVERRISDLFPKKSYNSAILEINFVFGSHPTEPYWVSR